MDDATAYHEAGYAILALVLRRPIERVSSQCNALRIGQVQMSDRRGAPIKDEVQARILLAGVVSEANRRIQLAGYSTGNARRQASSEVSNFNREA